MKIVQVHNYYQQAGGEDAVVAAELSLLRNHGHEVVTYYKDNSEIKAVGSRLWALGKLLITSIKTIWNQQRYQEFRELLRTEKPDVVHCHNTFPLISPAIYWACAKENVPVFLYVGGGLLKKRADLLLRAFASLRQEREAQLWIVGDGPIMDETKALADTLEITGVTFFGRIIDNVDPYFAAADFFVLPGIGGLALNQAMFWRTPCICSEADGTEEDLVLQNIMGFRFHANDCRSLKESMVRALKVREKEHAYRKMADAACDVVVRRNNVDEMIKTFNIEYNKSSNKGKR